MKYIGVGEFNCLSISAKWGWTIQEVPEKISSHHLYGGGCFHK